MRAFLDMLHWFAGDQIRNVAAIGGNIMTASPISDLNPILMANESIATFRLHSRAKDRQVLMDQSFFPKYRTTCAEKGEVLLSVHLPFNGKDEYIKAYKQSKRREDDIAIVNAAMRVVFHPGTCKVLKFVAAFGGMAATSVMPEKTMQNMIGRMWTDDLIDNFAEWISEDFPLSLDAPGGMVEYREALAASLFFKFFLYVKNCLVERGVMDEKLAERDLSALHEAAHMDRQLKGKQTWQEVKVEQPPLDKVGRSLQHVAGELHATGEAVYVDDIPQCSSELYLCLVTSIRPHAFIREVDVSLASTSPGFVTYVDHRDVGGSNNIAIYHAMEEVFATEKVTCIGQVIGAVVADSQARAQRAAQLVKIDYEDISPVVITIEEAVSEKSFRSPIHKVVKGNAEETMTSCDQVIEGEVRTAGQEHFYMETQVCLAVPKDGEEMEVYSSNQDPEALQKTSSAVLGVGQNKVQVRVKRLGGGFGGKATRFLLLSSPVIVAAAKCGRPVRCMLTRQEDMSITGTRHPFLGKYKIGCTKEGRLVSLVLDLFSNGGNTQDSSMYVMAKAMINSDNCYCIPNMLIRGTVCKTNIVSNTAFRGFGAPQAMFIAESWITAVAERLGLSTEKVRETNLYRAGDLTHFNQVLETSNARRCWEECMKISQFDKRRIEVDAYNSKNRWRKRGLACVPTKFAIGIKEYRCQAGALINIYTDGSVYLTHGGTEMGQGLHTKMIQIASRCLGIPVSRIHISETSTTHVPNGGTTAGSLGSDMNGMAVKAACDEIVSRLAPIRKKFPELSWDKLILQAYMERVSLSATGFYRIPDMYSNWDVHTGTVKGRHSNYYTYGAAVSEVEVDCLTGDHVVLQTDIVMDVGRSLNPAIDIGQIEGGFVQGYGMFTMEEPLHAPSGHLLTVGPGAYKIPGFGDCPRQFNVHLLRNSENDKAIYSSKGIGEPPFFLSASVLYAIKSAVGSARNDSGIFGPFRMDAPATAERIRMACGDNFIKQHKHHADEKEERNLTPWSVTA
uniref:Xanthine dehydrogenase/oxidase-like n=1 Tax=Phallusia mammillata TaxID=59560 RepID=A0A6F9DXN3_9ASCI|nr:xanthine dehydrogenase/oxidase-like [Phallusia mammillata]